jgi:hypothetical protein
VLPPLERQVGRHQGTERREGVVQRVEDQGVRGHDPGGVGIRRGHGGRVLDRV